LHTDWWRTGNPCSVQLPLQPTQLPAERNRSAPCSSQGLRQGLATRQQWACHLADDILTQQGLLQAKCAQAYTSSFLQLLTIHIRDLQNACLHREGRARSRGQESCPVQAGRAPCSQKCESFTSGCSGLTLPNLLRLSLFRTLACRRSRHPDPHLVVLLVASARGVLHVAVLAGLAEVPVHHLYNVHLCNQALLSKLLHSHWSSLRADITCRGSYQASSHCRIAKRAPVKIIAHGSSRSIFEL